MKLSTTLDWLKCSCSDSQCPLGRRASGRKSSRSPNSAVMYSLGIICLLVLPSLTQCRQVNKRQAGVPAPPQNPQVLQALDQLRGNEALSATQVQQVLAAAYPGQSYPTYSYIPVTSFSCTQVRQFGYYADPDTRCQVFRRCEANNFMFSYICPNGTVFNQITLVCDWFFNVNCPSSNGFFDYSNPRIYRQDLHLFDDYYPSSGGYGAAAGYATPGYGSPSSYSSGSALSGGLYGGSYGMMAGSAPIPAVAPATLSTSNAAASSTQQASQNTAAQAAPARQYRHRINGDMAGIAAAGLMSDGEVVI